MTMTRTTPAQNNKPSTAVSGSANVPVHTLLSGMTPAMRSRYRIQNLMAHELTVWEKIFNGVPVAKAVDSTTSDRSVETIYAEGKADVYLAGYAIGPGSRSNTELLHYAHLFGSGTAISSVFSGLVSKNRKSTVFARTKGFQEAVHLRNLIAPNGNYLPRMSRSAGPTTPHTSAILHSKHNNFFTIVDPDAAWLPVEQFPALRHFLLLHRYAGLISQKMVQAANLVTTVPVLPEWGPAILDYLWTTGGLISSPFLSFLECGGDCLGAFQVTSIGEQWMRILETLVNQELITL